MTETIYPKPSKVLADKRKALAPEIATAFRRFSDVVFRDGTLPRKTKQLIAVAVAHVAQCPYCIQGHTKAASHHPGFWGKDTGHNNAVALKQYLEHRQGPRR